MLFVSFHWINQFFKFFLLFFFGKIIYNFHFHRLKLSLKMGKIPENSNNFEIFFAKNFSLGIFSSFSSFFMTNTFSQWQQTLFYWKSTQKNIKKRENSGEKREKHEKMTWDERLELLKGWYGMQSTQSSSRGRRYIWRAFLIPTSFWISIRRSRQIPAKCRDSRMIYRLGQRWRKASQTKDSVFKCSGEYIDFLQ